MDGCFYCVERVCSKVRAGVEHEDQPEGSGDQELVGPEDELAKSRADGVTHCAFAGGVFDYAFVDYGDQWCDEAACCCGAGEVGC